MPRKPRFYLPGIPAHVIQRGNDRQPVFRDEQDFRHYLGWLEEGAEKYGCRIHTYVLMTNHVHLLVTPRRAESIGRMIQHVGRYYVAYINKEYGRTGTLWEGRHKASLVSTSEYFLSCSRYIEMNPVRAGMVAAPGHYRWSSYRCNALGRKDEVITPHALYIDLGRTGMERQQAYRELFRAVFPPAQLQEIRLSVQTGTPLGGDRFKAQIERRVNRSVGHAKRGRPKKKSF